MAFEKLPRHAIADIIRYITDDDVTTISKILSLRLVCHRLNTEVLRVVYSQDAAFIHYRILAYQCVGTPNGVSLERFVRGFVGRPKSSAEVLDSLWRALRDGVWILSVLLASSSDDSASTETPKSLEIAQNSSLSVTGQDHQRNGTVIESQRADAAAQKEELPDEALSCICKAYIDLLGEERAFACLDISWQRSPTNFEKLNDKTGHFWAFLAAIYGGRPHVLGAAVKACDQRFCTEDDQPTLKMHLAAGLIVAARIGDLRAAKTLLTHPAAKVSLRLQNMRFAGENAMEAAITADQPDIIRLFLSHGWNLTTLPTDYIRALRATAGRMKMSPMRDELLDTLIEGDCQQWRSESIVTGLYSELCKQGDLATCKRLIALLQNNKTKHDEWQWMFVDNGENDNIASPTPPPVNEDDFVPMPDFDTGPAEERTSLFHAVSNKHYDMITFLFENRSSFPDSMSDNFSNESRLCCFEYAVKKNDQEALTKLIPHIGEVCPRKLFIYATVHGNLPAMTTILPLIQLNEVINEDSNFFYFSEYSSDLSSVLNQLHEHLHPNNFLFQAHQNQSRNVKLGTFALVCAIKTLQVPATKFLLSHGCTIGTRLFIFSANLMEWGFARVYLPHNIAECSDCQLHTPSIGKWVALLALTRFSYLDWKHMTESGAEMPTKRSFYITRKNWFRPWRWRNIAFDKMDARIITGIQVPWEIYGEPDDGELEKRYDEMEALLRKWKLPHVFTDADHQVRW